MIAIKIEFFIKKSGTVLTNTDDEFFVMNNEVYRDNQYYTESQERTVMFEDFIERRPDIGWRVVNERV